MMLRAIGAACILLISLSGAAAQEGWRVQVTPYIWGSAIGGTLTPRIGGPSYRSELNAGEVIDRLDAAFFMSGTVRYDRFVLLGDLSYAALSDRAVLGRLGPVELDVKGRLRQTVGTLAGGYTVLSRRRVALDLMAGARAFSVEAAVTPQILVGGRPAFARTVSEKLTWVDPIVGARMRIGLTQRLSLIGYGDVGGLTEHHSWQVLGTLNYQLNDHLFVSAGYRHMTIDLNDGRSAIDVDLSGPLLGVTWQF